MNTIEEWRVSPSLPDYEVSSFGRLRRIPHYKPMPRGGLRKYGGQPTYGQDSKEGRMIISYKGKSYKVHRLVCEAFNGPKPFENAVVMHLDENYRNNRPENLQWGTQKENLNAEGFIAYCKSRVGDKSPMIKSINKKKTVNHELNGTLNS